MKKIIIALSVIFFTGISELLSQSIPATEVFLITCGPGNETYSIYGHSALRIVNYKENTDLVYNWGVFDFSTPNFAWKFAKGRLMYVLDTGKLNRFLQIYFYEQRWVKSQKINLEPFEVEKLQSLIAENLKPENIKYKYDFFYDDCSTRIRDLLEKSVGSNLAYSPEPVKKIPTFRDQLGVYQNPYPWLKFGIDLIMGTPGDKKANTRDRMFLPLDLMTGLSDASVNRNGRLIPLLQNPQNLLEFNPPVAKPRFFTSPLFVFSLFLILMIIFFYINKSKTGFRIVDLILFSIFSVLAILMIFFNFFTDHQQMKWNLNIIWLNPFIILCLISIILKRDWQIWFRIVFIVCLIFFVLLVFIPNIFNSALMPLVIMLVLRSSARSGFSWNPLNVSEIDE